MIPIVSLLAALALPPQTDCAPQFAPLHTGSHSGSSNVPFWRKEEAGEWNGAGWLGWTWNSRTLVPVTLVVRNRPKDRLDDADEVTVEGFSDVTFAVRCIGGLRAGPIQSADVINHSLIANRLLRVSLGKRRYELRLQSRRGDLADAAVLLTEGQETQLLYSAEGFADEPHFNIDWAGDLDGDGRLDLVVNLSRKYSSAPHRLLLSSRASGKQLVGEAAAFETGD